MEKTKIERTHYFFIILCFLGFVFLALDKLGWINWLKRPLETASNAFRSETYKRKLYQEQKPEAVAGEEAEKLEQQEREIADLKNQVDQLSKENEAMRRLLGAPLPSDWQFLISQVLQCDQGIMTIDQGSDQGVEEGAAVIFENVLLGKIIKVNPRMSQVRLLNHKESTLEVKVMGIEAKGAVEANAAGFLLLKGILLDYDLEKDHVVVTTGGEGQFPADLLIGKIDQVERNEAEIYQSAVVKPLVDYERLFYVFIIREPSFN